MRRSHDCGSPGCVDAVIEAAVHARATGDPGKDRLVTRALRLVLTTVLSAALSASPVFAYKISLKGRYHERMTVLAERCLRGGEGYPIKCPIPASRQAFTSVPFKEGKYWFASRWSDDPTRQTSSTGAIKFLWNVGFDRCVKYIGDFNDFPGVLCNGHYGTMQFLHSMASVQPGETVDNAQAETFDQTSDKLLGWTEFAFRIATGALPVSTPYCPAVRQFGRAGDALAAPDFPYCNRWRVGTLFAFTCSDIFNSDTCSENLSDDAIRLAATGALLHMIQDSYSRSHTGRGEDIPFGPYAAAEVRCAPVTSFYRYTRAQKKEHGSADRAPEFLADCSSGMDPITASARMIWLVENRCDPAWARELVSVGVVANRQTAIPASVEQCRSAKSRID